MKSFYLPLALTVGGNILYHVSQKSVPKTAHPLLTMLLAYAVSITACALGTIFWPAEKSFVASVRESNWAVWAIGVGIAAVEVGFLLAYRAGWRISVAPVVSSVAVSLLLIPIGLTAFKEQLSGWNVVGIVLCIAGLILVHK